MSELSNNTQFQMFQDSWLVYKKILDGNYMFHQQINQDLKQFCRTQFADQPVRIVELGCGDASQSCQIFAGCHVKQYLGYDLSDIALGYAGNNLKSSGFDYQLNCLDMLTGLSQLTQPVDIIFCSYSLHHLALDKKTALFKQAGTLLDRNGVLIMVDIIRDQDQSLSDYYQHYLSYADQHWHSLNPDELQRVRQHVTENDFPESIATFSSMGCNNGFKPPQILNQNTWHQTCIFHKA